MSWRNITDIASRNKKKQLGLSFRCFYSTKWNDDQNKNTFIGMGEIIQTSSDKGLYQKYMTMTKKHSP